MELTIRDINDPSYTETVPESAWKHYPKSKDYHGCKMASNRVMQVVSEADLKDAAPAEKKEPRIPEVVRTRMAGEAATETAEAVTEVSEPKTKKSAKP